MEKKLSEWLHHPNLRRESSADWENERIPPLELRLVPVDAEVETAVVAVVVAAVVVAVVVVVVAGVVDIAAR